MRYFFLLLLLLFLCTSGRAQNITITASIALADDQCNPVINDPDADCISVPDGTDMLTYLPGQDGDIIVTYRLTNNSGGTIAQGQILDSDRGTIIPVTAVNIPPGTTVTTNRIFPAETTPRNVTATVTANLESASGASISVTGTYVLDVVAPMADVEFGVARQADVCDDQPVAANCPVPYGSLNGQTITVGALDTFTTRFAWTNSGLSTFDSESLVDQDGVSVANTGFDQVPGQTLISSRHWAAPASPGTYNYSQLLTVTDFAGNVATRTVSYMVIVEAPTVSVEFGVARQADVCDDQPVAANCPVPYGALNGQIVTVGALDTFTTRFAWTNTGLGTFDSESLVDQDGFSIANTGFDQTPGQTLISSRHWTAPAAPGTYDYSQLLTATDKGGNVVTATVTYMVIVEAPTVSIEFGVGRQADICDNTIAPNCPVPYGALNGQTVTVGALDTFTTRFAWTNTGLGEYDLITLVDQDGFSIANTGFDQEPDQTLISSRHWEAPAAPGTYNYSQLLTITDQGGNVVTATVTYVVIVEAPTVFVEFGVANQNDVCPNQPVAPNCSVPYGALNGQQITVGAGDTVTTRFAWTNTGLGTWDLLNLVDQDGEELANTGFDQQPGQTLISAKHLIAPGAPGIYDWSQTLTVTDKGGNVITATVTFEVKVNCNLSDLAAPTALCRDRTINLIDGETVTVNAGQIDDGSFDGCGDLAGGGIDKTTFTCADEGVNVVTLTVGDLEGNSATCTANVTVNVEEFIFTGLDNDCEISTTAVSGGQAWHDINSPDGQLIAQVIIGNNTNIAAVRATVYKSAAMTEEVNGQTYLSKRVNLQMLNTSGNMVQPNNEPIYVRLYYTETEKDALMSAAPGSSSSTFTVIKTSDVDCGAGYSGQDAASMNTSAQATGCAGEDTYLQFFTGAFSTFYLFATDAILPVELTEFDAREVDKQRVQLDWQTTIETDNSHFEVEHSVDGRTFRHLGAVAGAGTSTEEQTYGFLHETPVVGQNYYRLRQVDYDGTATLSNVREVRVSGEATLSIYPNPATDELRIKGFAGGSVRIIDQQGRVVLERVLPEFTSLNVQNLPAGVYALQTGGEVLRFIKR